MSSSVSRRQFLQAGAGIAGGTIAAGSVEAASEILIREELPPDPNRELRYGVIGCGARGSEHMRVLNILEQDCEILAVCDVRQDRIDAAVQLANGNPRGYRDYRELLNHDGINAVLIALPHNWHAPVTIAALNKGYDVLCEKPMATTIPDCNAMIDAARLNRRILLIGYQCRHIPVYVKVKELIEAGEIGDVKIIWGSSFRNQWAPGKDWLKFMDTGGPGLMSESCHEFDYYMWYCNSYAAKVGGFGFCLFGGGHGEQVLFGNKGRLRFHRSGTGDILFRPAGRGTKEVTIKVPPAYESKGHIGTYEQQLEFIECVRQRKQPISNARSAREATLMALAAEQALRTEQVVNIRQMLAESTNPH